jgi:hypothetical protein
VDNESYKKLEKWFAEKYPPEWSFMNQINDNFSDLIKLMPDDYLMDFIDNPNFMKVQTRQEGDSKIIDFYAEYTCDDAAQEKSWLEGNQSNTTTITILH